MWGQNDVISHPQEWSDSWWKGKKEGGARLIVIGPRLVGAAEKADLYVPLRPGTDSYLALAMANVIIEEGLQDDEFIEKYTYGYEEFAELAKKYTPEEVEKITWTPAEMIRQVAREYATTKPALMAIGRGGNQTGGANSHAGWMMSRAITCLCGLCGQFGVAGAGTSIESSNTVTSGTHFHWPQTTTVLSHVSDKAYIKPTVDTGKAWGSSEAMYNKDNPYHIRVFIGANNLAASAGDQDAIEEAFKNIPLVVTYNRNIHWTASRFADILLPIASWAETDIWRVDYEARAFTKAAVPPMFESTTDPQLYKMLARKLAEKLGVDATPEEIWPWETDEDFINVIAKNEQVNEAYKAKVEEGAAEFEKYIDMDFAKITEELPGGVEMGPFDAQIPGFVQFTAAYYPDEAKAEGITDESAPFFPTIGGHGKLLFKADWMTEFDAPALPVPCEPEDSYYAEGNPIESGNWEFSDAVKQGYSLVSVGKGHRFWQFLSFNQNFDGGPVSAWHREAFRDAETPCVELNPVDAEKLGLIDGDVVTVESQYGKMEGITVIETPCVQPGTLIPPYHWGNVQNRIQPYSMSFGKLPLEKRNKLAAGWPAVGKYKAPFNMFGQGGQNTQSAVLCKVYKA